MIRTDLRSTDSLLNEIDDLLKNCLETVRKCKQETGIKVIGHYPTGVPIEILHAAGALPVIIWGGPDKLGRSEAYLPAWSCPLSRGALDLALAGKLDFLDGFILPQICDTTKTMVGIWRRHIHSFFLENLLLPRQTGRESARTFYLTELQRFTKRLEELLHTNIDQESLARSVAAYNTNRRLLRELFQAYRQSFGFIGLRQIYGLVELSLQMPIEKHSGLLQEILATMSDRAIAQGVASSGASFVTAAAGPVRLFFSGKIVRPLEIWDIVEAAGGVAVGDSICIGSGYFGQDVREDLPPLDALADHYLNTSIFDTFLNERRDRARALIERVKETKAQGVIFVNSQFCEAQNFTYPGVKEALTREGILSLLLETDLQNVSRGQLETRIQAFIEMIAS